MPLAERCLGAAAQEPPRSGRWLGPKRKALHLFPRSERRAVDRRMRRGNGRELSDNRLVGIFRPRAPARLRAAPEPDPARAAKGRGALLVEGRVLRDPGQAAEDALS